MIHRVIVGQQISVRLNKKKTEGICSGYYFKLIHSRLLQKWDFRYLSPLALWVFEHLLSPLLFLLFFLFILKFCVRDEISQFQRQMTISSDTQLFNHGRICRKEIQSCEAFCYSNKSTEAINILQKKIQNKKKRRGLLTNEGRMLIGFFCPGHCLSGFDMKEKQIICLYISW